LSSYVAQIKLNNAREDKKEKYGAFGLGESLFASAPVRERFVRDESN